MNETEIPNSPDALLSIVEKVKAHYQPPPSGRRKRGKQRTYSGLSFLLLAVVAVCLRTFKDSELHKLLSQDDSLRQALGLVRLPHRTTIGRRLVGLVPEAEAQIAALGQQILSEVQPETDQPVVSAIDGRMYAAQGPKWHKADREAERVPANLRNVDVESSWSKSGYRGWVQGYRLVLQGLVFPCPVPLFAAWRPNHENEAAIAQCALEHGQLAITETLLGDTTYSQPDFRTAYWQAGGWVLTPAQLPQQRRSFKHDLYDYRKETIELLFQRIIQAADLKACPVQGKGRNGAFVLASVWLYQVCFLSDYRAGKPLAQIKEHIDEARWRIRN